MSKAPTLLWFRQDLRLADQPALAAALACGGAVVPVFVLDESGEGGWPHGAASRWWLHHSLRALNEEISQRGGRLTFRRGRPEKILCELARETGAGAVYWNRRYEPAALASERIVDAELRAQGLRTGNWNETLLFEPNQVMNKEGKPFKVFTPFWRQCISLSVENPVAVPLTKWPAPERWPTTDALETWSLLPTRDWASGFAKGGWTPGAKGAHDRLRRFLEDGVASYETEREHPGRRGTSGLSPHLHFGEISPRQIWAAMRNRASASGVFPANRGEMRFLAELGWREFSRHLLVHFPSTTNEPLRSEFRQFPWAADPDGMMLRAWQRGRTGYPIVDAGMRELWATGWMHNRVRMIVASFLVKHLRLSWQSGAEWFWDTLVDADLAANTLGWQWSAGCGADAAPYFRIFNPVTQGRKFDAEGVYVRRWIPELARMPDEWIHEPWAAPADVLGQAGVALGKGYPTPIVDHAHARREALDALKRIGRKMRQQDNILGVT